jgi:23S rRNA (cytosine1962-C5)-methyltransferase
VSVSSPPRLRLVKDVAASLRRGHPWVFAQALALPAGGVPAAGAEVDVVDEAGAFLARGFFDPDGPIAVRVISRDPDERLTPALVGRRVQAAIAVRRAAITAGAIDPGDDALRLVNGEADGVPGFVLDRYRDVAVWRSDGLAAARAWQPHVDAVIAAAAESGWPITRIWARAAEGRRGLGQVLFGAAPPPPADLIVREGAMRFEVDVVHGQKTGLFLDQRPSRRLVASLGAGKRVLNLFAYTGGFSVAAAQGGAHQVTTVDLSAPAIDAARRNFVHSGIDPGAHVFIAGDCREFLAQAQAAAERWDLVVLDPPSFAPSERARPSALAAYRSLNAAAMTVLAPGGLLLTASCSSHVSEVDLRAVVAEAAAMTGHYARIVFSGGAGADHPVAPAFPEGRYLKVLLVSVEAMAMAIRA